MLHQILSITALLSFLSLGLIAEEVLAQPSQETEEQVQEENNLACACKKKKTNPCSCDAPKPTDEEVETT